MGMSIADAVGRLDPANDDHWTTDGLPRVDAVARFFGRDVVRRDITEAAPTANRAARLAASATVPPATGLQPAVAGGDVIEPVDPLLTVDLGMVAPFSDNVLELPRVEILGSLELVDRALAEIDRRAMVLARRRDQVTAGLEDLGRQTSILEAAKDAFERQGKRPNTGIRDYLERQKQARLERHQRAQKFIEAGTTAKDVTEQLAGRSKIDQVMAQRRPGPSGRRPTYPMVEP